jgi:phosphoribosyl-ATP pyrophosphohydrolase
MAQPPDTLSRLAATIKARRGESPDTSYTAKLLSHGTGQCAKKFGEEAFELALAAVQGDAAHVTAEAADVFYHVLVLLEAAGVDLPAVMGELERREGTGGLVEKANRGKHS